MYFLWYVLIGLAEGLIASFLVKGDRRWLVVNLVVGIVGAVLGGWLLTLFGFVPAASLASVVMAILGAGVLLWFTEAVTHHRMRDQIGDLEAEAEAEEREEENEETIELFSEKLDRATPCETRSDQEKPRKRRPARRKRTPAEKL